MYAVISDIHSNIDALKEVMKDIREQGVEEIICLGDIIGYGPSPIECIDVAMEHFDVSLSGNHEWAIVNQPVGFSYVARQAVEWHQKVLKPSWFSFGKKKARWKFIQDLPTTYEKEDGDFFFVHASPNNHREEYILRTDVDEMIGEFSPKVQKAFEKIDWACFIGHTHHPGVIFEDEVHFYTPGEVDHEFELQEGRKTIINIGSVGQPRDGNSQSCYVMVDGKKVTYRRVPYDAEKAKERVLKNKYLDDELGKRLVDGR